MVFFFFLDTNIYVYQQSSGGIPIIHFMHIQIVYTPPSGGSSASFSGKLSIAYRKDIKSLPEGVDDLAFLRILVEPSTDVPFTSVLIPLTAVQQAARSKKPGSAAVRLVSSELLWYGAGDHPNESEDGIPEHSTETSVFLMTFDKVDERETFLEEMLEVANRVHKTREPVDAHREGSSRHHHHQETVGAPLTRPKLESREEEEEASKPSRAGMTPPQRSLDASLSRLFSDVLLPSCTLFSTSPSNVQHRGVVQASPTVLETILLDRRTWELRPMTEQMENDVLRQVPLLAALFEKFVGDEPKCSPINDGPGSSSGDGREEEEREEANASLHVTREAFWNAVVRHYFCLAHTFLESEIPPVEASREGEREEGLGEETKEESINQASRKALPNDLGQLESLPQEEPQDEAYEALMREANNEGGENASEILSRHPLFTHFIASRRMIPLVAD